MTLGSLNKSPKPSLATRKGISWGLHPPSEDSSVLVLTTPSRHYIDARFALEGPSTSGPFWAFAGTAKYTPILPASTSGESQNGLSSGWSGLIRGEWHHPIDSMGNLEGSDCADLITLENGDQVETGMLENPETGKPDTFKEYWSKAEDSEQVYPCLRAACQRDGQVKGSIIRVGNWIQGIRQVGKEEVEVVRLHLSGGEWKAAGGSPEEKESIPIRWLLEENKKTGDSVSAEGEEWNVEEVVEA